MPLGNEKPASPGPPMIRVLITESAGQGVFTTRRIGSGDLIHTTKPLVSYPLLSSIHSVYYFCLRKLKPVIAFEDCVVRFYSQECKEQSKVFVNVERKADWSAYDSVISFASSCWFRSQVCEVLRQMSNEGMGQWWTSDLHHLHTH